MTGYSLRPYQEDALSAIERAWEGGSRSALVVLPTGCGKTILFSAEIAKELDRGGRVLVLAHRNELLKQAHDKLAASQGIDASYESGRLGGGGGDSRVTIGSVQTLSREDRLAAHSPGDYTLIIVDEAHHVASPTYKRVVDFFSGARLLGVTATPKRGDRVNVQSLFDTACSEYTIEQAIRDGYLSQIVVQKCPVKIDISGVRMQNGDFSARDVGSAVMPYLEAVAREIALKAAGRKTIIFTPLVEVAKEMALSMERAGVRSDWVSGDRPDSGDVMRSFERGDVRCLANAMLLTEGYDCPSVDCVVNLRPTKSSGLYTQIIGRGTRICEGKENLLVLDFLWQDSGRGTLSPMTALFADAPEEVRDAMDEEFAEGLGPVNIFELEERAKERASRDASSMVDAMLSGRLGAEKLMRLMAETVGRARGLSKRISALSPEESVRRTGSVEIREYFYHDASGEAFDSDVAVGLVPKQKRVVQALDAMRLAWYFPSPCAPAESEPPTEKQVAALKKMGFPVECLVSKLHAMKVMDVMVTRSKLGLASFKQVGYIAAALGGSADAQFCTRAAAARVMKLISGNKAWGEPSRSEAVVEAAEAAAREGRARFAAILNM